MAVSFKLNDSREIVDSSHVEFVRDAARKGCTAECISCHFSKAYLRDLNPEDIEKMLNGEYELTEEPSHGDQLIDTDDHKQISIPDGIYHYIVHLHRKGCEADIVAFVVGEKFGTAADEDHVKAAFDHYMENLPTNEHGVPDLPQETEAAPHPGHRIPDLPTAPFTPRHNGRSRTSFSRPPPDYSPRPTYRGTELRHPREVVPIGGHLGPFHTAGNGGIPNPPAYASPLANAQTAAEGRDAGDVEDPPISPIMLDSPVTNIQSQTTGLVESPLVSPRTLGDPSVDAPGPAPGSTSSHRLRPMPAITTRVPAVGSALPPVDASPTSPFPSSPDVDSPPDSNIDADSDFSVENIYEDQESTLSEMPDIGSQFDHIELARNGFASKGPALYSSKFWPDHLTAGKSVFTELAVRHEGAVHRHVVRGGIARAVLQSYPCQYRALTMAEAGEIDDRISQFRLNMIAPVIVFQPENPDPLVHALLSEQLANASYEAVRLGLIEKMDKPFEELASDHRKRHEELFCFMALEAMHSKDPLVKHVLRTLPLADLCDLDQLRLAFRAVEYKQMNRIRDRNLEKAAKSVREELASYGAPLPPVYDLDQLKRDLESGSFRQDEDFSVEEKDLNSFLLSLPAELEIFTEDGAADPFTVPSADDIVVHHHRAHPQTPITTDLPRVEALYNICRNVVAEIFHIPGPHEFTRQTGEYILTTELRKEYYAAGGRWQSLEMVFNMLILNRNVNAEIAADIAAAAPAPGVSADSNGAEQQDVAAAVAADGDEEEPSFAHIDISPVPGDTEYEYEYKGQLYEMCEMYGPRAHDLLYHFPADTVWTTTLINALPSLIVYSGTGLLAQSRSLVQILRKLENMFASRFAALQEEVPDVDSIQYEPWSQNSVVIEMVADLLKTTIEFQEAGRLTYANMISVQISSFMVPPYTIERTFAHPPACLPYPSATVGLEMLLDGAVALLKFLGVGDRGLLAALGRYPGQVRLHGIDTLLEHENPLPHLIGLSRLMDRGCHIVTGARRDLVDEVLASMRRRFEARGRRASEEEGMRSLGIAVRAEHASERGPRRTLRSLMPWSIGPNADSDQDDSEDDMSMDMGDSDDDATPIRVTPPGWHHFGPNSRAWEARTAAREASEAANTARAQAAVRANMARARANRRTASDASSASPTEEVRAEDAYRAEEATRAEAATRAEEVTRAEEAVRAAMARARAERRLSVVPSVSLAGEAVFRDFFANGRDRNAEVEPIISSVNPVDVAFWRTFFANAEAHAAGSHAVPASAGPPSIASPASSSSSGGTFLNDSSVFGPTLPTFLNPSGLFDVDVPNTPSEAQSQASNGNANVPSLPGTAFENADDTEGQPFILSGEWVRNTDPLPQVQDESGDTSEMPVDVDINVDVDEEVDAEAEANARAVGYMDMRDDHAP